MKQSPRALAFPFAVTAALLAFAPGPGWAAAKPAAPASTPKAAPTGEYLSGALGDVVAGEAAAASQPAEKPGAVLVRVVFDLLLVVVLLVAFLFALRWYVKRRPGGAPGSGAFLRIVDVAHLAPKKSVYLVEVADRMLVVGSAGDNLTLLSELNDPETVARLKGETGKVASPAGFLAALQAAARRTAGGKSSE